MATVLPLFDDGDEISGIAGAAITGGQVVEMTADRTVSPTGAASAKVLGIAPSDAAAGAFCRIIRDGIWPLTAAAVVVAGDRVTSAAAGQVAPIGAGTVDQIFGVVWKGAAAGGTCYVALKIT
jgi:hypothetical protein